MYRYDGPVSLSVERRHVHARTDAIVARYEVYHILFILIDCIAINTHTLTSCGQSEKRERERERERERWMDGWMDGWMRERYIPSEL